MRGLAARGLRDSTGVTMTNVEQELGQALLDVVSALVGTIAVKAPVPAQLRRLDEALEPVRPLRERFERQQAEQWLVQQARALKPAPMKRDGYRELAEAGNEAAQAWLEISIERYRQRLKAPVWRAAIDGDPAALKQVRALRTYAVPRIAAYWEREDDRQRLADAERDRRREDEILRAAERIQRRRSQEAAR